MSLFAVAVGAAFGVAAYRNVAPLEPGALNVVLVVFSLAICAAWLSGRRFSQHQWQMQMQEQEQQQTQQQAVIVQVNDKEAGRASVEVGRPSFAQAALVRSAELGVSDRRGIGPGDAHTFRQVTQTIPDLLPVPARQTREAIEAHPLEHFDRLDLAASDRQRARATVRQGLNAIYRVILPHTPKYEPVVNHHANGHDPTFSDP